ncbi:bile acid:sodium symporter family protein [Saliphagus infecundisoli]|uniref:Bile acid:sodium symporter family protein n=1 Tax=Saliphagus infecundisoli TaxID=1849069 RepID=A0ABD5Q8Z3_9EURY|nr:sodium symporter [Saliphagus infecundisoli]
MVEATVGGIVDFTTTIFVLSTMLSMGLELTIGQLMDSLRKRRLMAKSLVLNLVAVPLLAYLLVRILPMEAGYTAGFLLIAMAPGAPFGPKLAEISESDIAFASGLMTVLGFVSVVTIPLTVALLMPGDVAADPLGIAWLVFAVQLAPLVVGLVIDIRSPLLASRLYPPIQRLSNFSFAFLIVLLLVVYIDEMVLLVGTGALLVSVVLVGAALLLGYSMGGPAQDTREVLATTTAARNAAIALFIATTSFTDPNVLTVVLAFSFIGVVASGLIAGVWRQRVPR